MSEPCSPLGSSHVPITSAERIAAECDRIKAMLLEKNAAYGDTALRPPHIFSNLNSSEAIRARLDDKLSRHMHQPGAFGESEIDDLIGYLVLLNIAERIENDYPWEVHPWEVRTKELDDWAKEEEIPTYPYRWVEEEWKHSTFRPASVLPCDCESQPKTKDPSDEFLRQLRELEE